MSALPISFSGEPSTGSARNYRRKPNAGIACNAPKKPLAAKQEAHPAI